MSCALATFCSFLRSAKPRRKQRLSMAKWWLQAPAATPLWAAGILLLGIGPVWKWLVKGKREEDRFPKVPGLWFFGVTCEFGFNFLFHYFYPKMDQFSKQFGAEGAYELHVLGKRVVICCSWKNAPRRSLPIARMLSSSRTQLQLLPLWEVLVPQSATTGIVS